MNHHPETSKAAATKAVKSGTVARHHKLILDCLSVLGPCNGKRIAEFTGLDFPQVMRRMHEIDQIEDSGDRADGCCVWRLK